MTAVGLVLLGLALIGVCSHLLRDPPAPVDVEEAGCPACGWPPWSVLPCLCPEEERGPEFRGTGPSVD